MSSMTSAFAASSSPQKKAVIHCPSRRIRSGCLTSAKIVLKAFTTRAAGSIRAISSPAELLSPGERGDQSAFSGFVLSMTIFPVRASARLGKTPAHAV